jgi:hypothetical protein
VRFTAEHLFRGAQPSVVDILADPSFYLGLDLPDLTRPELLEHRDDGDALALRLRYGFVGSLDPIAQRLLGSSQLQWVQEVRLVRSTSTGSLQFEAERDPGRLHGSATFTLAGDGASTTRRLEGELVVAVPGIGRMAERRIVPGILRRMDIEAAAVDDRLSE